jgi:hypothetical protein
MSSKKNTQAFKWNLKQQTEMMKIEKKNLNSFVIKNKILMACNFHIIL